MLLVVLIVGVAVLLLVGNSFEKRYEKDVKISFHQSSGITHSLLTEADIAVLPNVVQHYIRNTGCIGKPKVHHFKASFTGRIRGKEQSEWMSFSCEQHNFLEIANRLFFMKARMKGLPVAGYHCFKNGKAEMDIRLLSLVKVQYARGKEMDISETVTFFNDMCVMAPATLIDKRIEWLHSDAQTVRCVFTNNGISIEATLYFNENHELINFSSTDRYAFSKDEKMHQLAWQTPVKAYKTINGFRLPAIAELIYTYLDGDFCYGEFNLKDIQYN